MPLPDKFWMVAESNYDYTYYYCGYYKNCKPVFKMAIADALHIATFESAKSSKIFPCEIWLVDNNKVAQVL